MAFVVENGTGLADATSFLSVAAADSYHADNGAPAAWTAASTATKEAKLVEATTYLESVYSDRWRGRRLRREQRLSWPRWAVVDSDGYALDSAVLPTKLLDATAILALRALTETLLPDVATPGAIKRSKVVAGPVEREIEYAGSASQSKRFSLAEGLLKPYVASGNDKERG